MRRQRTADVGFFVFRRPLLPLDDLVALTTDDSSESLGDAIHIS